MQQGSQWRALATRLYIRYSKIINDCRTGIPRDQGASSKLDGYGVFITGPVPDVLSV
jgi:hypothetical protein